MARGLGFCPRASEGACDNSSLVPLPSAYRGANRWHYFANRFPQAKLDCYTNSYRIDGMPGEWLKHPGAIFRDQQVEADNTYAYDLASDTVYRFTKKDDPS